ncbi:hypothetical protein [Pseudochryseolinea flava]|uniref:DUF3575 domain-containing protein n=1 Tax=Pseudochryseolinea flava TaxID=2059302 RepID=A0A364YA50_9BACT|nr:hypothetical protein [Pseudochryseolinea flava]RAW03052.1 hypothetical protein DQQ10_02845 [Pseudochryseolinea flava]
MKKIAFCSLFLLNTFIVVAQHNGLGIRIGEPMAITFKRYLPSNRALEFMIGTAPNVFASTYYEKQFNRLYDDLEYKDHETRSVFYTAARYLFQFQVPTEGIEGKLDWYVGFGGVIKTARVEYFYRDFDINGRDIFSTKKRDFDVGPEAIGGLEFTLQNIPLVVFGEMSFFFEVSNRASMRVFPGIGARYSF